MAAACVVLLTVVACGCCVVLLAVVVDDETSVAVVAVAAMVVVVLEGDVSVPKNLSSLALCLSSCTRRLSPRTLLLLDSTMTSGPG